MWPWVLAGVVFVLLNLAGGCAVLVGSVYFNLERESKRTVTVTYEATGPGTSVDITYKDRGDGYVDVDDMKLPWRTDATLDGIAKVASVIATNGPDDVGELACRITSNGRTLVEERGSGAYKVISCIATVDD